MSTKADLLKVLDENSGSFVSGEALGKKLGISRAAVNKAAHALKKSGYKILSRTGQGYKLLEKTDVFSEAAIASYVNIPCRIRFFETISSTSTYAKTLDIGKEPQIIIANEQTAGRGRLGRTFISPAGTGIYMSFAFRPSFELDKAPFITMSTALAVCHAIEDVCGINMKIKWVNDIFYNQKKVCGILTEAQTNLETGRMDSLVVGIGVNCFPGSFPEELQSVAGVLSEETGSFSRSALAGAIIQNMLMMLQEMPKNNFLPEYKRRCFILGKNVTLTPISGGKAVRVRVLDIEENGGLVVEYMEGIRMREIETVTTGEVSLHQQ